MYRVADLLLLVGVALAGVAAVSSAATTTCQAPKFADIRAEKKFEMERLMGTTWYQVSAAPGTGVDVGTRFYQEGSQLKVVEAGRQSVDAGCQSFTYNMQGAVGKYTAVDVADPTFTSSIIMLDTDYVTYFTSLACFHVNAEGTCDGYNASIYAANTARTLSRYATAKIMRKFRKLCIDDFKIAGKTGKECLQWNRTI